MLSSSKRGSFLAGFLALAFPVVSLLPLSAQTYQDLIGYTKLSNELGASLPTGSGVKILQIEASVSTSEVDYAPDSTNSEFGNVTFTGYSTGTAASWHATTVGQYLYGSASSLAPGITQVGVMYAGDFISGSTTPFVNLLNVGSGSTAPSTSYASYKIQNDSWVGSSSSATNTIILNRLDYMINRDNVVSVVGVNNGTAANDGNVLLSTSYNSISVGLTSGNHAYATTGIQRPDIVVPTDATSWATAIVSSAAAVLVQTASTNTSAARNVTIKAMLMAGATKNQFLSWSRSDTRPIDNQYGAGQLNIYNSYHIMTAGQQNGSTAIPSTTVTNTGWDYKSISAGQNDYYFFDLNSTSQINISLNWNAIYTAISGNYDTMSLSLANLNLYLYSVEDGTFTLDSIVQQSIATGLNLQYIFAEDLASGRYAIEVSSITGNASISYALAWQTIPEPSQVILLIFGGSLLLIRRRKQSLAVAI